MLRILRTTSIPITGTCITTGLILAGLASPANAADMPVDVLQAVTKATPDTVANAAPVDSSVAGRNVIELSVADTNVSVPVDPATGVSLSSDRGTASIGLPFAADAADAVRERPGVVSYDNGNGSRTVPVVLKDGSVQINTVIENANAPALYDYPITVPDGSTLVANEDGSVFAMDDSGAISLLIGAPWAKDANGKDIPTSYEITGTTLTQKVDHSQTKDVTYPVVADPWLGVDLIERASIEFHSKGYKVNVVPTLWGRIYSGLLVLGAHESELRTKLGRNAWRITPTIREQFNCHIIGNIFEQGEYNMESWLPFMPWGLQLNPLVRCNPGSSGYSS